MKLTVKYQIDVEAEIDFEPYKPAILAPDPNDSYPAEGGWNIAKLEAVFEGERVELPQGIIDALLKDKYFEHDVDEAARED